MFSQISTSKALFTAFICTTLSACVSTRSSPSTTVNQQDVTIQFAVKVGTQDIKCDLMDTATAGTDNTNPEFKDVRMYISNVELINAYGEATPVILTQDGKWQYENVALLDFETGIGSCANGNEALNHQITGLVPEGNYDAVRFTIGVPAYLNHYGIDGDDAVSPLDTMGMNWSWQKGHKHLRIDVVGWTIHLGTTGCEVVDATSGITDCANSRPNRPTYQLDNFNHSTIQPVRSCLITSV